MIGQMVSHYRILEKIGSGGMGVVYKGEDTRLQRFVAIKFLNHASVASRSWERFQREARAASALNHPNICTVYDIGEHEGEPFLVMEFLEGATLAEKLGGRPLPLETAIGYAGQIADALDAAHARGLMHRDIKPANIFVTARGQVKVVDFGLAKTADAAGSVPSPDSETVTGGLTAPGSTVGTIAYMSPEQARGGSLDRRTDIFSLGVVLYEMTTGGRPFTGSAQAVIFDGILNRTPEAPSRLNPSVLPELERVILRALEKDRDLRYQTAADLGAELKRLRQSSDSGRTAAAPAAQAPLSRHWIWIVAVALVTILAAALLFWNRTHLAGPEILALSPVTNSGHVVADSTAFSRDGQYLAYAEQMGDQVGVQLKQTATGSSVSVVAPEKTQVLGVTFSRDGNYLYVVKGAPLHGALYQLPVLGGTARQFFSGIDGPVAFSPDGRRIAFVRFALNPASVSVEVADLDGSHGKAVASRAGLRGLQRKVSWSPDGKTLAALAGDSVLLFSPEGGAVREFSIPGWKYIESLIWLPSGRGFLLTAEPQTAELTARHQILEVSYPDARVRRLTNDLNDHHSLIATGDVATLATVDLVNQTSIWVGSASDPDKVQRLNGGRTQGMRGLAWTKDQRLAFADEAGLGWVMNADGSGVRSFTADKHAVMAPSLCGPGPLLIFQSSVGTSVEIDAGDPDGAAPRKIAMSNGSNPTCTPDGKFAIYDGPNLELWRAPLDGGAPARFIQNAHEGELSPDGKWLAFHYMDRAGGPEKLAILPAAGGSQPRFLDAGGVYFHWNPDSTSLTIVKTTGEVSNLWELPLQGSPKQLTHFTSDRIPAFARSLDGRIAITRGNQMHDIILMQRRKP